MDVSIIIPRCARDLIVKFRLHDKIKLKKKREEKKVGSAPLLLLNFNNTYFSDFLTKQIIGKSP